MTATLTTPQRIRTVGQTAGSAVPLAAKATGEPGYDPAPDGYPGLVNDCDCHGYLWPMAQTVYVTAPDMWLCPLDTAFA